MSMLRAKSSVFFPIDCLIKVFLSESDNVVLTYLKFWMHYLNKKSSKSAISINMRIKHSAVFRCLQFSV